MDISSSLENNIPFFNDFDVEEHNEMNNIVFPEKNKNEIIKYFKNNKYIFKAILTRQKFGYIIKIVGDYTDYINIYITLENDIVTRTTLREIHLRPKCGFSTFLEDRDAVEFIKASLQFCQKEFPTMKIIEFNDTSAIEYYENTRDKIFGYNLPFLLAYFSLAKTGKTWYEQNFGAKMMDEQKYRIYRNATENLYKKIDLDCDTFQRMALFTNNQYEIIKPYFNRNKSWIEFFNSIPKIQQYNVFYNWLSSFIIRTVDNEYLPYKWYIDIDSMEKTEMTEVTSGGGGKQQKTRRKKRRSQIEFRNY